MNHHPPFLGGRGEEGWIVLLCGEFWRENLKIKRYAPLVSISFNLQTSKVILCRVRPHLTLE
jgi:hypothetical protein